MVYRLVPVGGPVVVVVVEAEAAAVVLEAVGVVIAVIFPPCWLKGSYQGRENSGWICM
jgi:hypothetical protein